MDTASVVFILFSSALVLFMTPGLAFFYGGLGRRKNVINTMMMVILPIAIAVVMWFLVGYSLAFSGNGKFIGNFGNVLFRGVSETASTKGTLCGRYSVLVNSLLFPIIVAKTSPDTPDEM